MSSAVIFQFFKRGSEMADIQIVFFKLFFVRRQLGVADNTYSKNISARSKLFKFCFLYNDFIIKRTRQSKSLLL